MYSRPLSRQVGRKDKVYRYRRAFNVVLLPPPVILAFSRTGIPHRIPNRRPEPIFFTHHTRIGGPSTSALSGFPVSLCPRLCATGTLLSTPPILMPYTTRPICSRQMIAKAVDAAAPSKERDAWYKRKAHWESNARRRQEARAATPLQSVVHAQGASASAGWGRPGVAGRYGGVDARGGPAGGRNSGVGREDEGDEEDEDDGFRLNKMQTVIAVAVMLVMAVMKIRGLR